MSQKLTFFNCYFTAFSNNENSPCHKIAVPTEKLTGKAQEDLDMIFHYGQNEFKLKNTGQPIRSLSMGDLIEYDNILYIVDDFGFTKEGEEIDSTLLKLSLMTSNSTILHEKFPSIFE